MRRCVWSRNLKNEEAMAHVGPQRHTGGKNLLLIIWCKSQDNAYHTELLSAVTLIDMFLQVDMM